MTANQNDNAATENEKAIADAAGGADVVDLRPEPDRRDCPVTPLGRVGHRYFFLSPVGELLEHGKKDFTEPDIVSLFDGDTNWLLKAFPRETDKGQKNGWSFRWARDWLMGECAKVGFFDRNRQVRGPGVWLDPHDQLIVHCGDKIYYPTDPDGDVWIDAGVKIDRYVYTAWWPEAPPEPPGDETRAACSELLHELESWNWRAPTVAPRLLLGWIAGAIVAGALDWRPAVWVSGEPGAGKTTLEKLIKAILGGGIAEASKPTEPGVRHMLGPRARAVILDEVEKAARSNRAAEIVELVRLGSSAGQAPQVMGGAHGRHIEYPINAMFYLTGVNPPAFRFQDETRITALPLRPFDFHDSDSASQKRARAAAIRRFKRIGPQVRGRMILGWDRFQANLRVWEDVLSGSGYDARDYDQLGTLLAGADTLLRDAVVTETEAAGILETIDLDTLDRERVKPSEMCWQHLLSSPTENFEGGRHMIVAELITKAIDKPDVGFDKALAAMGVKILYGHPIQIAVANRHRALLRLYNDTDWEGYAWRGALLGLERLKAQPSGKTGYAFGGARSKAVLLTLDDPNELRPEPARATPASAADDDAALANERGDFEPP